MFIKFTIRLIAIALSLFGLVKANNLPNSAQSSFCLIKNARYENEFLYTKRSGTEKISKTRVGSEVFTNVLHDYYMDVFAEPIWLLRPVSGNAFMIGNVNKDGGDIEYMCSYTDNLGDAFSYRRPVNMHKPTRMDDKKCSWKLEKIGNDIDTYLIRNSKYNEPLVASPILTKSRRKVYTWPIKPSSSSFWWKVECFDEENIGDSKLASYYRDSYLNK